MNKKLQNGLVAALTAAMGTGIVAPVYAATTTGTSIDAQYKAAYDATVKATASKSQADLTAARVLVDGLYQVVKGTPNEYLATTLSQLLDPAQQVKLVELFAAIDKADASVKQADINASRDLILAMPAQWVNTFSARIDAIQQKLIVKVNDAVVKAEGSSDAADKTAAQALVADVKTVTNNADVLAWANAMGVRADAVVTTLQVKSVSAVDAKTIQVSFNKSVDASTVIASNLLTNVTINYIGSAPAITATSAKASLSTDGKTLTIVASGTEFFNGEYAITVPTAVKDASGNSVVAYSGIVKNVDTVRPTIAAPTYPVNGTAKFTFSEPVNATAAQIAAAMSVTSSTGASVAVAAGNITVASDNKSFTLNIAASGLNLATDKAYTATFVGLKDYAGNLITPNPVSYTVVNSTIDNVAPTVVGITAKSDKQFTVQFSEALSAAPSITLGGSAVVGTVTVDSNDNTKYNVVLTSSTAGIQSIGVTAGYTDLSGNAGTAYTKLVQLVQDTTAPSVVSTTVSTLADGKQYLIVKYDETISGVGTATNALSGSYVDSDVVTHSGINVAIANATLYHADGVNTNPTDSLKVDLTGLVAGNYTMTVNAGTAADTATLDSNPKTATFSVGTLVDKTKPVATVGNVQVAQDKVLVSFNENVTAATALNVANYTVEGQRVFASAEFTSDRQHVTLTLNPNVITVGGLRNFTIANIASDAGVVMDSYTTQQTFVENVKPTITSAKLTSNNVITVTFSEGMTASTLVDGSDFTVKVNGNADAITGVAGSGSTYTITLTTPVANLTDTVTLTVAPTNNVTDAALTPNSLSTTGSLVVGQ